MFLTVSADEQQWSDDDDEEDVLVDGTVRFLGGKGCCCFCLLVLSAKPLDSVGRSTGNMI